MNKFHLVCFWSADGFQHQSWNHTALPQQMHSAVHIIIIHLNIIHMCWQDTRSQMCAAQYLHAAGERHCSKKHICSYIMHFKCISMLSFFLSFSRLSLSLMWEGGLGTQPCHINMHTGEMLPLLPPCCSRWGLQQWKQWLMSPDMAGHVSW